MKSIVLAALTVAFVLLPAGGALAPLPVEVAPTVAATHHVHMIGHPSGVFFYDPPVLHAAPGDTVIFHSHDIEHTATSGVTQETEVVEGIAPNANAFHTGPVRGGTSASVTVGSPGAYPYYCNTGLHRHFGMHGLLVAA